MVKTIVIDTSVIISALIGEKGPSREALKKVLLSKYKPLISNALFQKYEAVSNREQIRSICPLSNNEMTELLNAFYSICNWVPIYYLWRPNIADEADNFLIELALAGNASHIVTNNIHDLKNAELKFPSLEILTPEVLLRGE